LSAHWQKTLFGLGGSTVPRIKLTERSIARLAAPTATGKPIVYWDETLKGFGVLVSGRTSTKAFVAQRDLKGGRTRRVTIASIAELPLIQARERARTALLAMRDNIDPKAPRSATLAETADLYLQSPRLSPRTKEIYRRLVDLHLAPLKPRLLSDITPEEIDALHNRIVGRSVANSAIKIFRLLYNWSAARNDALPRNPCRLRKGEWHVTVPKRRPIPPEKLADFYAATLELQPMLKDFVLLLLFTGLRRREAAALRWSEIDFTRKTITLSGARTKTRKPLDVPMCDFVHDLLVARRQLGNGLFVFPSYGKSGHLEHVGDAMKILGEKIGHKFSCHDLRRTLITACEAIDLSPYAIKALVNHSLGQSVTEAYITITVDRLREPAQRVADRLKVLCGMQPPAGQNVAALRA
jgi:integrase